MTNLVLISVLVLVIWTCETNAQKNCPSIQKTEADLCFSKVVLYGDKSLKWGTNDEEIDKVCKSVKSAEKCVRKYLKNCLSGLSQQVVGLILKGAVGQVKKFCTNNKRIREDTISHSSCGNSNLESDHKCMADFVDRLKDATTLPDDIKLSSSCCSFVQFENCIVKRMENEKLCSRDDVLHFKNIVHSVAGEAMDFTCADFNTNPSKCESINNRLKKVKKSTMKGNSILLPMVELIRKIA